MSRPKKDSEILSCRIDKEIYEKLCELCNDTGLTKTKAVEKAVDRYYAEYKRTGRV